MESLLLSLLLAAAAASVLCGQVVEEPVGVGRPLLLSLGDHVRQRGGAVLRIGWILIDLATIHLKGDTSGW